MAQHRPFAGSQNGCHPTTLLREFGVANGVNAAVNAVKTACSRSVLDGVFAQAECDQLGE
jgi:hypothetical protein